MNLKLNGVSPRLLVIDDESDMRDLVGDVAGNAGFHCDRLAAFDEAVLVSEGGYDVIVLDLMMPDTDGIEVIRALAEAEVMSTLILVSGVDPRMLQTARRVADTRGLRVGGALSKPFRPKELEHMLQEVLEQGVAAHSHGRRKMPEFGVAELQTALQRREFVVHYQPQVCLGNGSWCGVEALARWQHPEYGLLFPDAFIHLVETSSLAAPFTFEILHRALKDCTVMGSRAGYTGGISVNVPARALSDVAFADGVFEALAAESFPPERLTLELTETDIPEREETLLDILVRLRMRGVNLSVDDFGTGHSGFERLQNTPFNELKIDMIFVRDKESDETSHAIVQSAIDLGHRLDMKVVAEGVETEFMLQRLKRDGCDVVQGYHVSRPGDLEKLETWARSR